MITWCWLGLALAQSPEVRADLATQQAAVTALDMQIAGATGDVQLGLRTTQQAQRRTLRSSLFTAIDEGLDSDFAPVALAWLDAEQRHLIQDTGTQQRALSEQLLQREGPVDEAVAVESRILRQRRALLDVLTALHQVDRRRVALGADPINPHQLDGELQRVADVLAGEILAAMQSIDRYSPSGEGPPVWLDLQRDNGLQSLEEVSSLMAERGLNTARYRQLLIQVTGEVTSDVLDAEVTQGLVQDAWTSFTTGLRRSAPGALFKALLLLVLLFATRIVAHLARQTVGRTVTRTNLNQLAKDFAVVYAGRIVYVAGGVIGLAQLGIDVTAVLAGLGVAGIVVGFALQDTLANFASGVMILAYRPFDVGDRILVGGDHGVVQSMTLVTTTLLTPDNKRVSIPNNRVWQNTITNMTAEPIRRVDLVFGVSYDANIDHVQALLREAIADLPTVLADPAPEVEVETLANNSVDLAVRPWCRSEDYFETEFAVTKAVKQALDAHGIDIPFPQRVVHLKGGPG